MQLTFRITDFENILIMRERKREIKREREMAIFYMRKIKSR